MNRFAVVALCAAAAQPLAAQTTPAEALARAERAFARDASERTISTAFLAAMAEEAVLFRPGAVPGVAWTRENPSPPDALLEWEPEYVEVAASGDLGVSTGPWAAGRKGSAERSAFGRFVSVWALRDGRWQVLIDHGMAHPGPRPKVELRTRTGAAGAARPTGSPADAEAALARTLHDATPAAWRTVLAPDARVLRDGHPPAVGAAAADRAAAGPAIRTWTRLGGGTAASGDLAWSYGEWSAADAHGHYLHVWRADEGRWRLALDLSTAAPDAGG